ncbi:MAG: Pyrrolo-quinoline quinone, partial [Planctomycetaceae bacterium]|nr:Pyrrolo-quinoline quinone [Planctomycetaceae bacterium]
MRLIVSALLLLGICSAASADDENWNQFRGPRGDGTSKSTKLPVKFGEGSPEIVWKTPIPGRAWSSPVVWGKQIWFTKCPEVHNLAPGQTKLDEPLKLSAVCVDLDSGKV